MQSVDLKHKIVTFTNGDFEKFDMLINTIPLNTFLFLLKEPSFSSLKQAAKKLLCNSVINFNIGLNRPDISDKHWIYLPEKKFIPYRLGFYHNFSSLMVPPGCSSLYGEIAYLHKPPMDQTTLVKNSLQQLKKLLSFSDSEMIAQRVINIDHAYVIFDFWREKNLPKLHEKLLSFNVHSIGRYGAWKYASMQESLLDGKHMAETIVDIKKTSSMIHHSEKQNSVGL